MKKLVNTCVIYGTIKVYYDYTRLGPVDYLNPIGNFLRQSSLHKQTQRFMENYLKNGEIPRIGDEIVSDELFSKLVITNILYDYVMNEGELWIKKIDDAVKEFVKNRDKIKIPNK